MHGANRLASNSLLEGLVFGRRIADALGSELPPATVPVVDDREPGLLDASVRSDVARTMSERVGVLRDDRERALRLFLSKPDQAAGTGNAHH